MMELREAYDIALYLKTCLSPCCERVEIAGSIRRLKATGVKDIEIVAAPSYMDRLDLFGNVVETVSMLDFMDWEHLGHVIKGGDRYKQVALIAGINLDLFIVLPPAQWGVIMTIRTGPAAFSKRVVTQKCKGGLMLDGSYVRDGAVYCKGELIKMDEEVDFFNYLGMRYILPEKRT